MNPLDCISFGVLVVTSLLMIFQKNVVSRFIGIKFLGGSIVFALSFGSIPQEAILWTHLFFLFALIVFLVMGHRHFIIKRSYLVDKESL